jgi:hypothetical protein
MSVAPSAGLDTFISTRKTKFDCGPDEIDEVGGVQDTGFVLVSPTLGVRQRVPPVMPLALPKDDFRDRYLPTTSRIEPHGTSFKIP